jgi:hypothetical protein
MFMQLFGIVFHLPIYFLRQLCILLQVSRNCTFTIPIYFLRQLCILLQVSRNCTFTIHGIFLLLLDKEEEELQLLWGAGLRQRMSSH